MFIPASVMEKRVLCFQWTKDNPAGSTDKEVMKHIFNFKKFLNCGKCNKRLNFLQYYFTHIDWCGREVYACNGWSAFVSVFTIKEV